MGHDAAGDAKLNLAAVGMGVSAVTDEKFSVSANMVIVTKPMTLPVLSYLIQRPQA